MRIGRRSSRRSRPGLSSARAHRRQIEPSAVLDLRGPRNREILDREPRRVEQRDLVIAGAARRVAREHVAELGDASRRAGREHAMMYRRRVTCLHHCSLPVLIELLLVAVACHARVQHRRDRTGRRLQGVSIGVAREPKAPYPRASAQLLVRLLVEPRAPSLRASRAFGPLSCKSRAGTLFHPQTATRRARVARAARIPPCSGAEPRQASATGWTADPRTWFHAQMSARYGRRHGFARAPSYRNLA